MKRILAVIVIGLLSLTGCVGDTSKWTSIEASYSPGSTQQQAKDAYNLVITPTSATLRQGGNTTTRDVSQSLWDTVRNSVSALGARSVPQACPGGQTITIKGFVADDETHRFEATSCETDSKVAEAKRILDLVVQLFR